MKSIKFYTLLYLDFENQSLSYNGINGVFENQIDTFIKCCETLNNSLKFFIQYELIVLTNNKAYIEQSLNMFKCIEIQFSLELPKDIRFFAAHHKIDVFRYLSNSNDLEYSILLDSDVLCINKMPLNLINCIKDNIPTYYDITEQVYPAYSRETIITNKEFLITGKSSIGIWAGGEFIGGDNKFFKLLSDEIGLMQNSYFANYKQFHHQGDETLVSTAIEKIMQHKYICNIGLFGGIGRFWSVKTRHFQKTWKSYEDKFLVHLPADKKFLASLKNIDKQVVIKYEHYLKEKEYLSKKKLGFLMRIKKRIIILINKLSYKKNKPSSRLPFHLEGTLIKRSFTASIPTYP